MRIAGYRASVCFLLGWLQPSTVELRACMLIVESGPHEGKAFGPIAEHATIGREPLCDIGLTDRSVSKQHCELSVTDEGIRLRDPVYRWTT